MLVWERSSAVVTEQNLTTNVLWMFEPSVLVTGTHNIKRLSNVLWTWTLLLQGRTTFSRHSTTADKMLSELSLDACSCEFMFSRYSTTKQLFCRKSAEHDLSKSYFMRTQINKGGQIFPEWDKRTQEETTTVQKIIKHKNHPQSSPELLIEDL